jgi:hypothetical protein
MEWMQEMPKIERSFSIVYRRPFKVMVIGLVDWVITTLPASAANYCVSSKAIDAFIACRLIKIETMLAEETCQLKP